MNINALTRQADRYHELNKKAVQNLKLMKDKDIDTLTIELTVTELTDIAILCGNNETIIRRKIRELRKTENEVIKD